MDLMLCCYNAWRELNNATRRPETLPRIRGMGIVLLALSALLLVLIPGSYVPGCSTLTVPASIVVAAALAVVGVWLFYIARAHTLETSERSLEERIKFCQQLMERLQKVARANRLSFTEMTASLKKSVGEKIAEREAKAHGMSRTLLTLIVSVGASAVISYVSAVVGGSVDSESLVMPVLLIAVQLMLLSSVLWWLGTYVATKVINKFNYLPQDELRRFRDDLELMCLPMADAPTAERPK